MIWCMKFLVIWWVQLSNSEAFHNSPSWTKVSPWHKAT